MNNKLTPERIAPRGALIMAQQEAETSPGYGEFYADPEEIYLDVIIDSWPRNKPPPTLDDLEIVEYVRAEVVGL